MPAAVIKFFVVVVQNGPVLIGNDLHFDVTILEVDLNMTFGSELMVQHQAAILVGAEQERNVQLLDALVAL